MVESCAVAMIFLRLAATKKTNQKKPKNPKQDKKTKEKNKMNSNYQKKKKGLI